MFSQLNGCIVMYPCIMHMYIDCVDIIYICLCFRVDRVLNKQLWGQGGALENIKIKELIESLPQTLIF